MGHYAYLDSFEPIDRVLSAKTPSLNGGKTHVPLFWLAMFEEGDLRDEALSGVRYAARPDDHFSIAAPYLITDSPTAAARLKRRTAALATICTPAHRKVLKDFSAFARRLKPSLVMRLDDLAAMGSHAAYVESTRSLLRDLVMLDNAHATADELAPLVKRVLLSDEWIDREHAPQLLSGWDWQVSVEVRAQRSRERKWQQVVGDRPDADFLPYTVNRSFAADELIAHDKLGRGVVMRAIDGSKVEVLFRDGTRTLVHGRTG